MDSQRQDRVTLTVTLVDCSKKAILVVAPGHGSAVWLPVRLISFDEDCRMGETIDVNMPAWLAKERGMA